LVVLGAQLAAIGALVARGASLDFESQTHDTALLVAAQTGNLEAVRHLVKIGAKVIHFLAPLLCFFRFPSALLSLSFRLWALL
jgi:hypothetical protein